MPIELGLGAARILAASAGKATGVAVQCRTAADAAKQLGVASYSAFELKTEDTGSSAYHPAGRQTALENNSTGSAVMQGLSHRSSQVARFQT